MDTKPHYLEERRMTMDFLVVIGAGLVLAGWSLLLAAVVGFVYTYVKARRSREINLAERLWWFVGAMMAAFAIFGVANILLAFATPFATW